MTNLSGKTVIVTGANSGIGKETARGLARMGARIVMVCRSPEKGRAVRDELLNEFPGKIDLLLADLSSLRSIETLARDIEARYPKVDVLLHNAGVFYQKRVETSEGIEATLATNHIGIVHLTELLLPLMKRSAPSRIIITSSATHKDAKLDLADLQTRKKGVFFLKSYAQSKLLNLLYMRHLEPRLQGTGVTVNCLHPGVVATNIVKGAGLFLRWFWTLASKTSYFLTPEEGARTSIYVASEPTLEKTSGKYFSRSKVASYNKLVDDPKLVSSAWEETQKIIHSIKR